MDRLRDVIGHSHEFIICGRRAHALYREVTNGPHGITQTKWECCRGVPGEIFRGERLPSSKLCHDVGEGQGEAAHILPGRSGSQEGIELALQPPIVEAKELVAPRDMGLRCAQLQLLEGFNGCVEYGGARKMDGARSSR